MYQYGLAFRSQLGFGVGQEPQETVGRNREECGRDEVIEISTAPYRHVLNKVEEDTKVCQSGYPHEKLATRPAWDERFITLEGSFTQVKKEKNRTARASAKVNPDSLKAKKGDGTRQGVSSRDAKKPWDDDFVKSNLPGGVFGAPPPPPRRVPPPQNFVKTRAGRGRGVRRTTSRRGSQPKNRPVPRPSPKSRTTPLWAPKYVAIRDGPQEETKLLSSRKARKGSYLCENVRNLSPSSRKSGLNDTYADFLRENKSIEDRDQSSLSFNHQARSMLQNPELVLIGQSPENLSQKIAETVRQETKTLEKRLDALLHSKGDPDKRRGNSRSQHLSTSKSPARSTDEVLHNHKGDSGRKYRKAEQKTQKSSLRQEILAKWSYLDEKDPTLAHTFIGETHSETINTASDSTRLLLQPNKGSWLSPGEEEEIYENVQIFEQHRNFIEATLHGTGMSQHQIIESAADILYNTWVQDVAEDVLHGCDALADAIFETV